MHISQNIIPLFCKYLLVATLLFLQSLLFSQVCGDGTCEGGGFLGPEYCWGEGGIGCLEDCGVCIMCGDTNCAGGE